ncbi:hypothetical protein ACFLXO_04545 [Chloroflexota bacterium]
MAGVVKTKRKNKEGNRKRVEWDSTTEHAFMRLSGILVDIIHSWEGGDSDVEKEKAIEDNKKGGKKNDNSSGRVG